MKCPICKEAELQEKALICPECKASSPYALLEGFSPVKKISDELKKSEGIKKRNTMLIVGIAGAILLFIGSVVYAIAIKNQGTVVKTVVDEEATHRVARAGLGARVPRERCLELRDLARIQTPRLDADALPALHFP